MNDFADIVSEVFGFLASEGFESEVQDASRVVFSNNRVSIQLGLDEHGEFGMTFDRVPPSQWSYPFEFYLRTFFPDELGCLDGCVARSRLELEIGVKTLARLLMRYGRPILEGDISVFEKMDAQFRDDLA